MQSISNISLRVPRGEGTRSESIFSHCDLLLISALCSSSLETFTMFGSFGLWKNAPYQRFTAIVASRAYPSAPPIAEPPGNGHPNFTL
jgi:hypothetical protein